jgi:hypothetical protein
VRGWREGVEDDVFEEADFDAKGDDLAELCDEAELLAAGAAVGEGEVGGAGGFDSGGEVGGVEVEEGAEVHGGGGDSLAFADSGCRETAWYWSPPRSEASLLASLLMLFCSCLPPPHRRGRAGRVMAGDSQSLVTSG